MSTSDSPSGVRKPSLLRRFVKLVICLVVLLVALFWYQSDRRMERDIKERARFYHLRGDALKAVGDERLALLDGIITEYAGSGDTAIEDDYWEIVFRRAELAPGDAETAKLLERIITWADNKKELTNKQRLLAGQAFLMRGMYSTEDISVRLGDFDRTIAFASDIPDTDLYVMESQAHLAKAHLLGDKPRRLEIADSYLAKAGHYDDPRLQVATAMFLRIKADATEDPAAREAVLKEFIDRYGEFNDHLVRESLAWAMEEYAKSGTTREDQIARYMDLFFKFKEINGREVRAVWRRADSELDRLAGSKAERQDLAIAHMRGRVPEGELVKAMAERANLYEDLDKKREAIRVIVDKYDDSDDPEVRYQVASIMGQKLMTIGAWPEMIEACDEIIHKYSDTDDERILSVVANAFMQKAWCLTEKKEQITIFEHVANVCIGTKTTEMKHDHSSAVTQKMNLTGDLDTCIAEYRYAIENSTNPWIVCEAMMRVARYLDDKDEKIAQYDQVISRYEGSKDVFLAMQVYDALKKNAGLTEDASEKVRIYDKIIALDSKEERGRTVYGIYAQWAILYKARVMPDEEARLAIYDKVIAESRFYSGNIVTEARRNRAELLMDTASLIAYYDGIIASGTPRQIREAFDGKMGLLLERDARTAAIKDFIVRYEAREEPDIRDKVNSSCWQLINNLLTDREEKITTLDAFLRRDGISDGYKRLALQAKVGLVDDIPEKISLYDEILKLGNDDIGNRDAGFSRALLLANAGDRLSFYNGVIAIYEGQKSLEAYISLFRAYLGKISLVENPDEAIVLYDKVQALFPFPDMQFLFPLKEESLDGLNRLSKVTGQDCVDAFLDGVIAGDDDTAASAAYLEKAKHKDGGERLRIYGELVDHYGDFMNMWVRNDVVKGLFETLKLTDNDSARIAVLDKLLTYDGRVLLRAGRAIVSEAKFLKAGYTKGGVEKIALYDEIIDTLGQTSRNAEEEDLLEKVLAAKKALHVVEE